MNGNHIVKNGKLKLMAHKRRVNHDGCSGEYSTGMISSHKSVNFREGYFEIRAKFAEGMGLWNTFWALSNNNYRVRSEIDVAEFLGRSPKKMNLSYHWDDKNDNHQKAGKFYNSPSGKFTDKFSTFAVDWQRDRLVWYHNGRKIRTLKRSQGKDMYFSPDPMYLVASFSVGRGSGWAGEPNRSTKFPTAFEIDHIRLIQRQKNNSNLSTPDFIKNGSFEDGSKHWKLNKAEITRDSYSGSKAVKLRGAMAWARQTVSGLKPYTLYRLTARLKKNYSGNRKGTTPQLVVKNFGGGQQMSNWTNNNKYTYVEVTFMTGKSSKAEVSLYQKSGDSSADNIQLKVVK